MLNSSVCRKSLPFDGFLYLDLVIKTQQKVFNFQKSHLTLWFYSVLVFLYHFLALNHVFLVEFIQFPIDVFAEQSNVGNGCFWPSEYLSINMFKIDLINLSFGDFWFHLELSARRFKKMCAHEFIAWYVSSRLYTFCAWQIQWFFFSLSFCLGYFT